MYGYQGAESRGTGVKVVVVFVGLLIAAAFVAGWMLADSYWGNPPREEAEAETIRIVNKGAEERQRIELDAYQRLKDLEIQAAKERAQRALWWQDRWNELGMGLIITTVAGLLTIAGIRIAVPVAAEAWRQYADARSRLAECQTKFEATQATRMREERQLLEEMRRQRTRVTLDQRQDGGNGREHSSERSTTMTPPDAGVSSTRSRN